MSGKSGHGGHLVVTAGGERFGDITLERLGPILWFQRPTRILSLFCGSGNIGRFLRAKGGGLHVSGAQVYMCVSVVDPGERNTHHRQLGSGTHSATLRQAPTAVTILGLGLGWDALKENLISARPPSPCAPKREHRETRREKKFTPHTQRENR